MQIEDGKGRGYSAGVNKDGQLVVYAVVENEFEYISHELKQGWCLDSDVITTGAVEKALLHFTYNGSVDHFHVHKILISSSSTGWFKLKTGGTASGGASITPLNLNLGSGVVNSNISALSGSTALTYTGGSKLTSIYNSLKGESLYLDAALIIGFGQEICILYEGANNSEVNVTVLGYIEEIE